MPPIPSRIAEDLRGQLIGEVLSDDLSRRLYATDASLYELLPTVVVRPRKTADVVATMRYAADNGLPVHARGAGSGVAGGCLGEGIVIDFSRFMRRMLDDQGDTVTVQSGMVHAELNRRLGQTGRLFAPDPESTQMTTLGGVAAVNASGSRRPAYGSASDHIASVTAVLADGSLVKLGKCLRTAPPEGATRENELATKIGSLLASREELIREKSPTGCVNSSGYALDRALTDDEVNLTRIMVGSEGTLGLITELELNVIKRPQHVGATLLIFSSLERAAQAVQVVATMGIAACDLMDRRHLGLARELDPRYEVLLSGAAEALLYVEVIGDREESVRERLEMIVEELRGDSSLAADALIAETEEDYELFSGLAHKFVAVMHGLKGNRRAAPGIEDIAVPPAALPQFFVRLQEILKRRQITATIFGHAAYGQLHIRPLLDFAHPPDLRKLETLAGDLYDTVWLLGGTMSGAHGDGLSRTPFTSRQHGPLVNVFREVKKIFDPEGLLNPGKVVPSPGVRMTHNPRKVLPYQPLTTESDNIDSDGERKSPEVFELQLDWDLAEATEAARACNGCGACRSRSEEVRMCPIFRYSPREEASPRAKANLLRAVATGQASPDSLLEAGAKEVADLCVHCHMCRLECPAEVDIPKLMVEAKAAYVKTNALPWDVWWASNFDNVAKWLALIPRISNRLFAHPQFRWLVERTLGIAASRKLPRLATRSYLKQAAIKRLHKPALKSEDRVCYFVDTYANHFDTELAKSFERILNRHQVGLYVPQNQLQSGMAFISQGALDDARRVAERNVQILAEAVRQGHTIVATEPAAVLALTHEYLHLLPNDEDAQLVAANTHEACNYLWRRHLDAKLQLDLNPMPYRVACHTPCHILALGVGIPSENLLRLIPKLRATRLEKGCSGMAGAFGLLKRNYRTSLRAGLPLLSELRSGRHEFGSTECGACRTQMQQGSSISVLHPIKLLAASYGLMPEVIAQLDSLETINSSTEI